MESRYEATRIVLAAYLENMALVKDGRTETWMLHKASHTFGVVSIAEEIMLCDAALADFPEAERDNAVNSAILHDLGRFYQHENGVLIRRVDGGVFDHGRKAAELLEKMGAFCDPLILFAIDEHDSPAVDYANPYYAMLDKDRRAAARLAAGIVRDADKLENIRNFCLWRGNRFNAGDRCGAPLSEHSREFLKGDGKVLLYDDLKNQTDEVLAVINWINDIEFDYTRKAIEKAGFFEKGIEVLRERGATDGDIELVHGKYAGI